MKRFALLFPVALLLSACDSSQGPSSTSVLRSGTGALPRAHAHNDYEHTRPLLDALDQGFTSVEADVYTDPAGLTGGLYVAHDPQDIDFSKTLRGLYLEPLKARAAQNGGCIHADCTPFYLLIDAKTEHESTYSALENELATYSALLTRYENGGVRPGAVTAVLSGNRPLATMKAATSRHLFYDGRLSDLDSTEPVSLIPLISDSWSTQIGWDGNGEMPAAARAKFEDAVARAHAKGRRVRFYATPDAPGPARDNIWRTLIAADVEQINTDDLAGLRAFLLANDPLHRR